jgi:hypothetical protein
MSINVLFTYMNTRAHYSIIVAIKDVVVMYIITII